MPIEIKWYGDELLKQIREATPDGLFDGAEMLVEAAKANAPKKSGNLRDSGYAATHTKSTYHSDKRHRKEIRPKEGEAVAAFAIFYASFVEFGTGKASARPFLRPALDEMKKRMGETIVVKIRKRIK